MTEDRQRHVNPKSTEFKEGVEAGLNSPEDTKNWIAGNDLGQALRDEPEGETPAGVINSSEAPLFMKSSTERPKGNAQDEKIETEE